MKNFKPLALAAAVSAVSMGVNAQPAVSTDGLGDMAIIPYYSVEGNFQTGMHIINTSDQTQVVKLRFRRASDSMDALDIDLVMSPKDVWTGSLSDDSGELLLTTQDTTCTVPENSLGKDPGVFAFPDLYREGAEEGYIEVIAMGTPYDSYFGYVIPAEFDADVPSFAQAVIVDNGSYELGESGPLAEAAEHVDGVPRSCDKVRDNFFSLNPVPAESTNRPINDYGNANAYISTMEWWTDLDDLGDDGESDDFIQFYEDSDNVLRVSYFLRDATSGLEFGSAAVHVHDFLTEPAMTNQQYGLFSGDTSGFDYPDLNGGVPIQLIPGLGIPGLVDASNRTAFEGLRAILGVESVLNDWSTASDRNVSTDWVVTFPGQYTMLDYYFYTTGEVVGAFECGGANPDDPTNEDVDIPECDFRDLPIRADLSGSVAGVYDREEGELAPEDGDLVVSPSIPGAVVSTEFRYEVNVIEWSDGINEPVLGSNYTINVDTSEYSQPFGWAQLAVSENNKTTDSTLYRTDFQGAAVSAPAICDWVPTGPPDAAAPGFVDVGLDQPLPMMFCSATTSGIPMVGFVAWERSFPSDPSANYGRIIDHASTLAD